MLGLTNPGTYGLSVWIVGGNASPRTSDIGCWALSSTVHLLERYWLGNSSRKGRHMHLIHLWKASAAAGLALALIVTPMAANARDISQSVDVTGIVVNTSGLAVDVTYNAAFAPGCNDGWFRGVVVPLGASGDDENNQQLGWTHLTSPGSHSLSFTVAQPGDYTVVFETPSQSVGYCTTDPDKTPTGGASAPFTVAASSVTVDRIGGADRYEVAVNVSKKAYPATAMFAILVTGENYPDALSAVSPAVRNGGPLLLTPKNSVPAIVIDELKRLNVNQVFIVGGPNSVSPEVEAELKTLPTRPTVTRVAGADRYETSRNVMTSLMRSSGPSMAYLATGSNFPDALSSGAAASSADSPVLLVDGGAATVNAATTSALELNGVTTVKITGGPNSFSTGIESSLKSFVPTVQRFGGADRFGTSFDVNTNAFPEADQVFLATGLNFPDALSGGVYAGREDAPLFVIPRDCVPLRVLDYIKSAGVAKVTLLGGPVALSPEVQELKPCAT